MNGLSNHNLIGVSKCFRDVIDDLIRFAKTDVTILIEGETGTGKELAARAAHECSDRQGKPFIPVNCGALPEALAESELFGCEKGAYTDAKQARRGLVMEANNGTLFLDEVEAMPPRVQVAILRFLQDRSYRPVGSTTLHYSNVRVIAATNMSLEQLSKKCEFRSDLIFRLKVLSVHLPPLRERGEDVLILAKAFLHRFSKHYAIPEPAISKETESWFERYHWPGNVRELENILLRGLFLCKGGVLEIPPPDSCLLNRVENPINLLHFESKKRRRRASDEGSAFSTAKSERGSQRRVTDEVELELDLQFSDAKAAAIVKFELQYLSKVLHQVDGNVTQAARISGTERSAFRKLLRRHNLNADAHRLK